ncbi:MAG: U32 family peptidase [Bacteroidales bacterium]|nr:U32 family peptidase [Bacteroidales bacterium]
MTSLELLAPARNMETGVAAIDCGADAVYIAGPDFGARKAAGNKFSDIAQLCSYAHRFGARVFVTYNILIRDDELDAMHSQMLQAQEAGADAFIIRDPRIAEWEDIRIPLHASTQCAIRDESRARQFEALGCSRIILERELSLQTIRRICAVVRCEVEFFVHGALCVCYSGDCRLSEHIDGRSADRGECIQACRSLYDLSDSDGRVLLKNKAVLSLKDYNLKERLEDLADAGVSSFKIEGRLKNVSYVKNVVRDYDIALNALVDRYPDKYARASFGHVTGGFTPDSVKTFNRGYTQLYLDGKRGKWSSMDAPKSMGEAVGTVERFSVSGGQAAIVLKPFDKGLALHNGDGFAFSGKDGVTGFRGDVCDGLTIRCKDVPGLRKGLTVYRNINSAFEKTLETMPCHRYVDVNLRVSLKDGFSVDIEAETEDGRTLTSSFSFETRAADNPERMLSMLREQLSKRSSQFCFKVNDVLVDSKDGSVPLLKASCMNSMRREIAAKLDAIPVTSNSLGLRKIISNPVLPVREVRSSELMRSKYCVRHELGICSPKPLYLSNNGKRFKLNFDCANCEMTLSVTE